MSWTSSPQGRENEAKNRSMTRKNAEVGVPSEALAFLTGGGEMGKVIAEKDWSRTALGPIETWPQSLRTTVSLCLASNFPISLAWGPERIQIYNDGYWPICGAKHPHAMAQDFKDCWASAWPVIGPAFESATAGQTAFLKNQRMFLDRNGYLEEVFFTFSFSPIRDESGAIAGLFHPVTELTQQSLAERRLEILRVLAEDTANTKSVEDAGRKVTETLARCELDLPFVLLYLFDSEGKQARLAHSAGLPSGIEATPSFLGTDDLSEQVWPLSEAVRIRQPVQVDDLQERFGPLVREPYPEPISSAFVMPLFVPALEHPLAVLVVGVSPRREPDTPYRQFYGMLAEAVTNVLAKARAYEEERSRSRALAELDRAKTAFFSNVSHEFRTPLTLMLGPLEAALSLPPGTLPPEVSLDLEVSHRNGLRLLRLVNTLLDFSRIEAGRLEASFEPLDLAAYTADLASNFRSAIEKAGLKLVVDCDPLPEPVFVDRDMWEKIVLNLLSNAFKFTLEGEISLRMEWLKDRVVMYVADSGVGIPPNDLPRVFERFHRVKETRARTHEGTGIGLALVRELVRMQGGDVSVESSEGQGTTFCVTVPTGQAHLRAGSLIASSGLERHFEGARPYVEEAMLWLPETCEQEPAASMTEVAGESAAPSPSTSILIVDDNRDMRTYLRRLLGAHYQVETVPDGLVALERIQSGTFDLVLSDVMMPGLDGLGLVAKLRSDENTRTLPVILLSARAGEEARVEGAESGADDYLVKPFSARELLARVSGLLRATRLRQQAMLALRARDEAQAANRMKSQFLANFSHEIRTPMSGIIGMLELVRDTSLAPQQQEYLETMSDCGESLLAILDDMLDLSRIEAGSLRLELQRVDMQTLLRRVGDLFKPASERKGLRLMIDSAGGLPPLMADPNRVRQLLINLVSNAIKYTETGEVEIKLLKVTDDQQRIRLRFEVRDTGIGIPLEVGQRIFQPFFQVDDSFSRVQSGTGLGLGIVKGLVHAMDGQIGFESVPKQGSTFWFEATFSVAQNLAEAEPESGPKMGRVERPRLLVAEDNPINARILLMQLQKLGYEADLVGNGSEALGALQAYPYRLVLLDCQMPVMDGYEAVQKIRQHNEHTPIVVALTAHAVQGERERCLACGMNDFLTKPVSGDKLAQVLHRWTSSDEVVEA